MTTVVVSPHLDDAVLSVPALIAARAATGEPVIVLTVFTEGDCGYAARRVEDRAALALLGAEPVHLGLRDAPYRRAVPRTFRALVLSDLPADDEDMRAVHDVVAHRLEAIAPETTLLPLGVGEHVDHRVVHAIHGRVHGAVGFYADRPYALVPYAVEARLARLGATVDGRPVAPSKRRAAELVASACEAPFVRAYLDAPERQECLHALAASLCSPSPPSGLSLRREHLAFDVDRLALAARAVRAYASQTADLFGDWDIALALSGGRMPYEETLYCRGASPGPPTRV